MYATKLLISPNLRVLPLKIFEEKILGGKICKFDEIKSFVAYIHTYMLHIHAKENQVT